MTLYHAIPRSRGVENGLKRAKQMVDFSWSPLKPIPSNLVFRKPDKSSVYVDTFMKPGLPTTGVIYSSARIVDKHVGFEVALETFATALENPDSVLYTRNLHGTSGHGVGCYYGIVCSAFASYVHDLPFQVVCKDWPSYEGISGIALDMENYPDCLNKLELLDLVLNTRQHIAVITDILTDADGDVQGIEVSESTMPVCCRHTFTPEEFRLYFLDYGFEIYRNANVDRISYTPCAWSYVEGDEELIDEDNFYDMADAEYVFSFMCDYGNKANYALGEPVILSVFDETIKEIAVYDDADREKLYPVTDGRCTVIPETPGIYFAQAVNGAGEPESVTWFVYDLKTSTDRAVYKAGEPIELCFRDATNRNGCIHYYVKNPDRYKVYTAMITDEERNAGKLVIPGIETPGEYIITVYSASPYAQYGSRDLTVTVV